MAARGHGKPLIEMLPRFPNVQKDMKNVIQKSSGRTVLAGVVLALSLLLPRPAAAGEFRVMPISLEFEKEVKSGVITVANEGKDKLTLQISLSEWTQDVEGKDVYAESADLVFYPRIMTLEPKSQQIIRVGTKGTRSAAEKTYRLFIEEIPEPKRNENPEGAKVSVAIRFAPPLFVKPLAEAANGIIEKIDLSRGALIVKVKNTGNVHVTITAVAVRGLSSDGKEVFSREIAGWYLLHGASRAYTTGITADVCRKLSNLAIDVKTDQFTLNGSLAVQKEMCSP